MHLTTNHLTTLSIIVLASDRNFEFEVADKMNPQTVGVSLYGRKFRAQLNRFGRIFYLGVYSTREEAARAYDHASLLSEAWSKRPIILNFGRPDEPVKPVTPEEETMLTYLRTFHGTQETQYQEAREINAGVPTEQLQAFQRSSEAVVSAVEYFARIGSGLQDGFIQMQIRINQLEKKLEYSERMHRDALREIGELRLQPKFTMPAVLFKRVIPGVPSNPPAPEATPPSETQVAPAPPAPTQPPPADDVRAVNG